MKYNSITSQIMINDPSLASEKRFWETQLVGQHVSAFPPDFSSHMNPNMETLSFDMPQELLVCLREKVNNSDIGFFIYLLAALKWMLCKYRYTDTVIVGVPVFGLDSPNKRINDMLLVRSDIHSSLTVKEWLNLVKSNVLQADSNHNFPVVDYMQKIHVTNEVQGGIHTSIRMDGLHHQEYGQNLQHDCMIHIRHRETNIQIDFVYDAALYARESIEQVFQHWMYALQLFGNSSELQLNELELLTADGMKNQQHWASRDEWLGRGKTLIHTRFEEIARLYANRTAVVSEQEELSYQELNNRANILAHHLRDRGVKEGTIVGLMLERSIDMIVAILGVLKAGGAYLPLDAEYPQERLSYMLQESGASLMIADQPLDWDIGLIVLSEMNWNVVRGNLVPVNRDNDLAYMIFTSGTTGQPKGVMVEHKNVIQLLLANGKFNFGPMEVWSCCHSFCFDFSVWEMYGALLYGGKLIIVSKMTARNPRDLLNLLRREKVTILNQTPTSFNMISEEEMERQDTGLYLHTIIFGGEKLNPGILRKWKSKYPIVKLVNMYGITETTVHTTYKEIDEADIELGVSNIGVPLNHHSLLVLDDNMKRIPIGAIGELYVSGECLARGYKNNQALTDERFIPHPYKSGDKCYRTGDLVKWNRNTELVYIGRKDQQVKIRGHRIEIGEIEQTALHCPFVTDVFTKLIQDDDQQKLCLYYVSQPIVPNKELRQFFDDKLPAHMIPTYLISIPIMPITINGKVDKNQLPDPLSALSMPREIRRASEINERVVSDVWQSVLKVDELSLDDSFYELGGDSIKAIQIASRLHSQGMNVEVEHILKYPILADLIPFIDNCNDQVLHKVFTGETQLTPIQHWLFEYPHEFVNHYNQGVMLFSDQRFDAEVVEKIFKSITDRHDSLRMTFNICNNVIVPYINERSGKYFDLEVIDYRGVQDYRTQLECEADKLHSKINIQQGPLIKILIAKANHGDHLLIVIHHLIVDGVSWRILLEELDIELRSLKNGSLSVRRPTTSYHEWSNYLYELSESDTLQAQRGYWKFIKDCTQPIFERANGTSKFKPVETEVEVLFTVEETRVLVKEIHHAFNTRVHEILITALGIALHNFTGDTEFVIDLEGHGREVTDSGISLTKTIGWFTSIFPFHLKVSAQDLTGIIKQTKEQVRNIPNGGLGFGVLRYLQSPSIIDRSLDLKSDILFNYLGEFDSSIEGSIFSLSDINAGKPTHPDITSKYVLEINSLIVEEKLRVTFTYDSQQLDIGAIESFTRDYKEQIIKIMHFCKGRAKQEKTLSDFAYKQLTNDRLSAIQQYLENIN
ncbi:hypothetical protein BS614_26175 [Paenibacillus xylanexedens]|uniref:non-ribosomal peptide synthetase n=1 Tax=Paenibacillus xylanexedens TaxID=528191 RepID=UPI0009386667|nr:non-ribosomal peptide synthetase [Paenibacillus xylanexedens]APO47193.1 hypothetical protein BS614_26175 [Paenibacillus xylanexedens]